MMNTNVDLEFDGNNVTVAVRLKPLSIATPGALNVSSEAIVIRRGDHVFLRHPKTGENRQFAFDKVFDWESHAEINQAIGTRLIEHAQSGYNSSLFAYGQTGSGKTHTMLGTEADPGLIPRVCAGLFDRCEGVSTLP